MVKSQAAAAVGTISDRLCEGCGKTHGTFSFIRRILLQARRETRLSWTYHNEQSATSDRATVARSTVAVTESVFEISSLIFVPSQNLKPPRQARRAESALDDDYDGPGDDGGPVTTGPRGRRAAGRLMDLEIAAGGRRMGLEMAGQVAGSRVWMPVTRTVVQVLFG